MFDLDEPYESEMSAFGEHWVMDGRYEHGNWKLVAVYDKDPSDGDGQDVEVYCCALPARFYKVVALEGTNSIGRRIPGWELSTGSGMAEFAAATARHAAEGMVAVKAVK